MIAAAPRKTLPLLARDVQAYRLCEDLTEVLIYPMAILSPWAFGTTDQWAMWVMNAAGYALGVLPLRSNWRFDGLKGIGLRGGTRMSRRNAKSSFPRWPF